MTNPILEVCAVQKSFGGQEVLRGVDFEILGGEILGLVGPNGAGKTTLLRCLVSVYHLSAGSIRISGIDVGAKPVNARALCSYLPGETSLYSGMSGQEMLDFARSFYGDEATQEQDEAIDVLAARVYPLPLERKIKHYSAGMKQKLALRIALSAPTPLFLLDEPDRALDKRSRQALYRLLLELKRRGRSILISSHHLAELSEVADRCVYLVHGQIASEESVEAAEGRLSLVLRARLPGQVAPLSFSPGVRILEQPPELHLEADCLEDMDEALETILPLRPSSVEYGRPSLQEIYDELYEGEGQA